MKLTDTIQTNLLPQNKMTYSAILPSNCEKVLFWLHGYRERAEQLLQHEDFVTLAEQHQIAILFPDVPDTYYLNQPWNHCYTEDFLISEFIPSVTEKYHLPNKKEQTFLAGISMGGFGSLLLGSHYPEHFHKIACISGAFILDDLLIGNPEVTGVASNVTHFQVLFGDIPSLAEDPARNPGLAAMHALSSHLLPPVYLTCGTEDLLYPRNKKLRQQLQLAGANIAWSDARGNHDWNFFAPAIAQVIHWFAD